MLPAPRRRFLPASLVASGALTLSVLGATLPATAAPVTTSLVAAPTAVTAPATTTTTTLRTAAVTTPAVSAARAYALRVAHERASAVRLAESRIGSRYVAGRTGPHAFDCSGLAVYVAKRAYGKRLPHYSRAQYRALHHVSRKNLRPGDLVFFLRGGTHHVGIYIGRGLMVSATNPRGGVRIDSVFTGWYGQRYTGAARVV